MAAHRYGNSEFEIAGRLIGPRHPCYVIAEAGANHNQDLKTAKRLIDVAADAGADAVKFQTYTAEGLYSKKTPMISYVEDGELVDEGESVWDMIKRNEMPWEWHAELASYTEEHGLEFLSTPFEEAAIEVLEDVGVPAYKIASYEIGHLPLIRRCAATGKPLLLSTGTASLADIERALDAAADAGAEDLLILHCAVNYPPRLEDLNLRALETLQYAFQVPVGWSDHTLGHTADVVAVALGACAIEKHFTLDRRMEGPDHRFALEPDELAGMVTAIREAEASLGSSIKRRTPAEEELAQKARRGLVLARDVAKSHRLERRDLAVKRPGFGFEPYQAELVVGRRVARDLTADHILTPDDLE